MFVQRGSETKLGRLCDLMDDKHPFPWTQAYFICRSINELNVPGC